MSFKNSVGYLLHELAFLIDSHSDQVLRERLGIGYSQFKILMVLEPQNGTTQRAIAESLSQSEPSISRQVKILKDKGLVDANPSKSNKKERQISLTFQGEHMLERASYVLNNYHGPMFETLSEKQRQQLYENLSTLQRYLAS